jgi:ribosomal protein S18 acetylase RimI-like enzyme
MSDKVQIAPATEADLPAIKTLLAELMEAMKSTDGFEVEQSIENCRKLMQDPDNYMLIARDNERILGFVNFTTRKTIMHPGPSGLIDELVVSKSSRGSGIGKRLIAAVIERCRELGCCEVEVSTEKGNARARRFYKSCGIDEEAVLLEIDL